MYPNAPPTRHAGQRPSLTREQQGGHDGRPHHPAPVAGQALEGGVAEGGGQHAHAQQQLVALHHAAAHCTRKGGSGRTGYQTWCSAAGSRRGLATQPGAGAQGSLGSSAAQHGLPLEPATPGAARPRRWRTHPWRAPPLQDRRAPRLRRCQCPAPPPPGPPPGPCKARSERKTRAGRRLAARLRRPRWQRARGVGAPPSARGRRPPQRCAPTAPPAAAARVRRRIHPAGRPRPKCSACAHPTPRARAMMSGPTMKKSESMPMASRRP